MSDTTKILEQYKNNEITLEGYNILVKEDCKLSVKTDLTTNETSVIELPKSNVIKYHLNDNMWFVLRPSGTEPKLKIYYGVVADSLENSDNALENLSQKVLEIINTIE